MLPIPYMMTPVGENIPDDPFLPIRRAVIKRIRGEATQEDLSRKLGVAYNLVYRWESGAQTFLWRHFLQVTKAVGIDCQPVFREALQGYVETDTHGAYLLRQIIGERPAKAIAADSGISQTKVARWISGDTEVPFEGFLRVLSAIHPALLFALLRSLAIDPNETGPVAKSYALYTQGIDTICESPSAILTHLGLQLASYASLPAHSDSWLAEELGLEPAQVANDIRVLAGCGMIDESGGRYHVKFRHLLLAGAPGAKRAPLRKFLMERLQRAILAGPREDLGPTSPHPGVSRLLQFLPLACDAKGATEIEALLRKTMQEALRISEESAQRGGTDHLRFLNVAFICPRGSR